MDEEAITDFIGNDYSLLKLAYSGQIQISIQILDEILYWTKNSRLQVDKILDLGGADGWASKYLIDHMKFNISSDVVDKNFNWRAIDEGVNIFHCSYSTYRVDKKYKLIMSILGAGFDRIEELYSCIGDHLDEDGFAFVGLRIASESHYKKSLEIATRNGLTYDYVMSKKLEIFDEGIPFICLKRIKNSTRFIKNDYFLSVRYGYLNRNHAKRVFGFEADVLNNFIDNGEILFTDLKEFDNGSFLKVDIVYKNEIIYRRTTNNLSELIIEYPVQLDDPLNCVLNQLERMWDFDIWNNADT